MTFQQIFSIILLDGMVWPMFLTEVKFRFRVVAHLEKLL